jgi:hypothetical protein
MTTWQQINADDLIFFADEPNAVAAKYELRKSKPKKGSSPSELATR